MSDALGRMADYLRWVAPSLVTIIAFPVALVGACLLTAVAVKWWLCRQYEVQDRPELQAAIAERDGRIRDLRRELEHRQARIGQLTARIRENRALASQLAINHEAIDDEEHSCA